MKDSNKKLDVLIEAMNRLITKEVAPVAPVLPVAPVAPVLPVNPGDHDLIVGLVKDVATLQVTVNKIAEREDSHLLIVDYNKFVVDTEQVHKSLWENLTNLNTFRDTLIGKMWGIGILAGGITGVIGFVVNKLA